jgi:hypothetical protein
VDALERHVAFVLHGSAQLLRLEFSLQVGLGMTPTELISIAVDGKVSESFGPTLAKLDDGRDAKPSGEMEIPV